MMIGSKKFSIWNILIVLIIIALVFVWVMSLGQASSDKISKPKEFKEDREQAKRKHKWYRVKLRGQKKLKAQLDKKFKLIHFGMRLGLFLLWGGIIFVLYLVGLIASLTGVMGYTAGMSGFIVGANYLTTGTYYDLRELAEVVKIRTENWVYRNSTGLEEKIESSELKIEELDSQLKLDSPK